MNIRSFNRWTLAMLIAVAALFGAVTLLHNPLAQAHRLTSIINCSGPIQPCIDSATDGDTIAIAAGDYTESLTLNKPVSLTGVDSATTIIHAMPSDRVLTITGATITNSTIISGLTFTGGNLDSGSSCLDVCGAGILITGTARPLIQNVTIINNRASANGGGIYATSALTLTGVELISNTSVNGYGGGLYAESILNLVDTSFISNTALSDGGGAYVLGAAILVGGQFISNTTVGGNGGGLQVGQQYASSILILTGTEFVHNTANYYGGGAYIIGAATLTSGWFENNGCSAYDQGGGLYVNGSALILSDTVFIRNISGGGGGVYVEYGNTTIVNSRFQENFGGIGGGLRNDGFVAITDTLFISNSANTQYGGGGLIAGSAQIIGSRFENNTAGLGGGLYVFGTTTITGTVFKGNGAVYNGGAVYSGMAVIDHARFEGNTSAGDGGGLSAVDLLLTDTQFVSNTAAGSGGAIFVYEASIANTRFTQNAAGQAGAALTIEKTWPWAGNIRLQYVTIVDIGINPTSAIEFFIGTLGITDTIIANHSIAISTTPQASVYEDYNLFYNNITNTLGSITSGGHSLVGDPKFIDPTNDDYHLGPNSAAIDAGVDVGITTDLDGNPRDSLPDIGAYEGVAEPIVGLAAFNDSPTAVGSTTNLSATVISGTNVVYEWNFGDGQLGSGAIITHAYAAIGSFTAIVTASNGSSGPLTMTTNVSITDAPISGLSASNDSPTLVHHLTTLTATVLSGSNIEYQWNFGDGFVSVLSSIGTVSYMYPAYGSYTITVTATNSISTSSATTLILIKPYRWYFPIIYKH